ncbi:MAG TPA: glycoside hydrolase family 88 protein, partial [Chitinophagaceae bacterium]|nr:glycoside hydrolase family 88 protein [Chitinophagaceae bacterium]
MHKRILLVFLIASQGVFAQKVWQDAEQQTRLMLKEAREFRTSRQVFPRTIEHDSLKLVRSGDWTSGFFPGMLWFMYERTKKEEWKNAATEFTSLMNREPYNGDSHDVGFKVYNSYGNGFRLTKDTSYKRLIIDAARTLCSRFNPKLGVIKSWDFSKTWQYPVIIDNMMNLELLFEATRFSGDSSFYKVAVTHANTTLKNHFRADNSSYHVVDYDTVTGQVREKTTAQGFAAESAWARGQAWGLYGYTMCYRETKNKAYLQQADHIAQFILKNLPSDLVPYWDYNVPDKSTAPRDASAAAITASALYELSRYSKQGKAYRAAAGKILKSLTDNYRAPLNSSHGFILLHSTGHKPAGSEVDVPIIYADYYYLEAL